jgi:signal recognition particle subunit SEC65
MSSNAYLPLLTEEAWNNDSLSVLDGLIAHFYASDYSQTYIYKDQVASLAYLIYQNKDHDELRNAVSNTLERYVRRYFDEVDVKCEIIQDSENPGLYTIIISCIVIDNEGVEYSIAKAIKIKDSKLKSIVTVNNEGV